MKPLSELPTGSLASVRAVGGGATAATLAEPFIPAKTDFDGALRILRTKEIVCAPGARMQAMLCNGQAGTHAGAGECPSVSRARERAPVRPRSPRRPFFAQNSAKASAK